MFLGVNREYHKILGTNYQNNIIHVHTSLDCFAYQIIAGNQAANTAGMNFVPDISCPTDSVIDLIPDANKVGNVLFAGGISISTLSGSEVTINDEPISQEPVSVTLLNGLDYDVYRVLGVVGDIKVASSSSALVSTFGVSAPAGYGGYFSGFDSYQEISVNATICEGESHDEGHSSYTESGVYSETYESSSGCDSIVITNLTVIPKKHLFKEIDLCEGETHLEGASELSTAGSHLEVYQAINGCDSIVTTQLNIHSKHNITSYIEMCQGEYLTIGDSVYDESGEYEQVLQTSFGCDSIRHYHLTILDDFEVTNQIDICQGEVYEEGESSYSAEGLFSDLYQTINGCDSMIYSAITVYPSYTIHNEVDLCSGEFLAVGDS